MLIRPARQDDIPAIAEWTATTFPWGDYVAGRIPDWLANPASQVLVAEIDDAVVATVTGTMVSPHEAWAQGIRVHPEHRRKGLATAVSEALWEWARRQGGLIVRLAVDEDNHASQSTVTGMGFRHLCDFHHGVRVIGEGSPIPEGNGGKRVAPPERLAPANSAEAEPAFLSWSTGDLARAARGLLPIGWVWRQMTVGHLTLAARNRDLYEGRPGWAIAELDVEDDEYFVHWMETTEDDAVAMAKAIVDRAADSGATRLRVWVPDVPWLIAAFARLGCEYHRVGVWARQL